jgi:hypothetical protein
MKNKLLKYITLLKKRAEEKRDEAAFESMAGAIRVGGEAEELERVIRELEFLIDG